MANTIFIEKRRVCVKPLRSRLDANLLLQKLRLPTTIKRCRSSVGMVNFLSIFFPDVQKVLKSIYDLTGKGRQFIWGTEQQIAL